MTDHQLLIGGAILLGFFLLLTLISLRVHFRLESRKRELAHIERLKALETGRDLSDAEISRARAVGWVAGGVPVFSFGMALGATGLVLTVGREAIHVPVISVVWGISGAVGLMAVVIGLAVLPRAGKRASESAGDSRSS